MQINLRSIFFPFFSTVIWNFYITMDVKPMELWELDKFLDKAIAEDCHVINLSHRGLTIVTDRLQKVKSTRVLLLNHNKLLMPPDDLCNLSKLTELVLDNNMLTMFPSGKYNYFFVFLCFFFFFLPGNLDKFDYFVKNLCQKTFHIQYINKKSLVRFGHNYMLRNMLVEINW